MVALICAGDGVGPPLLPKASLGAVIRLYVCGDWRDVSIVLVSFLAMFGSNGARQ